MTEILPDWLTIWHALALYAYAQLTVLVFWSAYRQRPQWPWPNRPKTPFWLTLAALCHIVIVTGLLAWPLWLPAAIVIKLGNERKAERKTAQKRHESRA